MENTDDFLTTPQVSRLLGISIQRVNQFIQSGRLEATKVAGEWRIRPEDVEAIRERKTGRPSKHEARKHEDKKPVVWKVTIKNIEIEIERKDMSNETTTEPQTRAERDDDE